jgi:hypothetical protein
MDCGDKAESMRGESFRIDDFDDNPNRLLKLEDPADAGVVSCEGVRLWYPV